MMVSIMQQLSNPLRPEYKQDSSRDQPQWTFSYIKTIQSINSFLFIDMSVFLSFFWLFMPKLYTENLFGPFARNWSTNASIIYVIGMWNGSHFGDLLFYASPLFSFCICGSIRSTFELYFLWYYVGIWRVQQMHSLGFWK